MLQDGSLKPDEQQWALILELARLYEEICSYGIRMDEHHVAMAEYQARRLERLQQLLAEESAQREREEEARRLAEQERGGGHGAGKAASQAVDSTPPAGWATWLRSVVGLGDDGSGTRADGSGGQAAQGAGAALARERLAAARREETLLQELGPGPTRPEPPRGMYVWGSVGSGKSMLVGLLYQALSESGRLPACRWMHFNAAMLEIHARLHHLDSERQRLHRPQQRQPASPSTDSSTDGARHGTEAALQGHSDNHVDDGDGDEEEDEAEEVAEGLVLPGGLRVRPEQQGVLRHWDPASDPEVARQKGAKAAMLAIRRHMRLARLGRNDPRTLAAANAQGLVRAAAAFIRGRPGDPLSGWGGGSGPIASLLVFDEVQVTDVFSAVALKGLVEALSSSGCVLVATSNRAPLELPRHGLHEAMWGHFIETLLNRCTVYQLSSPADYRRVLLEEGRARAQAAAAASPPADVSSSGSEAARAAVATAAWPPSARSYLYPAGPGSAQEMEALWRARLAAGAAVAASGGEEGQAPQPAMSTAQGGEAERSLSVPVLFGRTLEVRRASPCGGAAWFSFEELCARPLGPADYVALSQRFDTVFVSDVPAMSMQVRDQARRFITLVDELYNGRCLLVASGAVAPEELFTGAEGQEPILDLEGLQFETAVEGARLRRDATAEGGVAPVGAKPTDLALTVGALGGVEERFAFRRAVSRLLEMQSEHYMTVTARMRRAGAGGAAERTAA
ncbi:hypothetical protein GPECTOR_33g658 [Gonium pectorale]|uniref:AAA+ ATPase domain-containing protein n=1 Tax=Gonium pectorale TaxID=33097 RepID=A0A150GD63_GONPE|nr:hypothetical protein GPECTOR_33g658 [Gonium pectorale]|eukprot:KXZ47776.1 hypothetical protein GPECTOR_33g658 [Gonium pectorale]